MQAQRTLQDEYARLKQENEELRQELANTNSELWWLYGISMNKSLSGNQKSVLIAARYEIGKNAGQDERDGLTHIYRQSLADRAGISAQTVSAQLSALGQSGIITRKLITHMNPSGQIQKELYIGIPKQTEQNPDGVLLAEGRNHGGTRNICKTCGSQRLHVMRRVTCEDCGAVAEEHKRPLYTREVIEDACKHDQFYEEELVDLADIPYEEPPAPPVEIPPAAQEELMPEPEISHEELGRQFFAWFTGKKNCGLRLDGDGTIVIQVPESLSEDRYNQFAEKVMKYDAVIRKLLKAANAAA